MRRSLSFTCQDAVLAASLDDAPGDVGVLIVTGGTEIRSGAHGGLAQLAAALAEAGHPVFRFDRRGVGDSEGEDPGFADSGPDLAAAAAALKRAAPHVRHIIGFGLCDGATALALQHRHLGLSGMILVNPWVIEPRSDDLPPPAAIRRRYVQRLVSVDGWKRLLTGGVDYRKLLRGVTSLAARSSPGSLADRVAAALAAGSTPLELIVAREDATALAFLDAWRSAPYAAIRSRAHVVEVDSRSHSFARRDEPAQLGRLCLEAIARLTK